MKLQFLQILQPTVESFYVLCWGEFLRAADWPCLFTYLNIFAFLLSTKAETMLKVDVMCSAAFCK